MLEELIEELGINKVTLLEEYEIYKSYIPELEYQIFLILEHNGMLGRLFRGQRIDLPRHGIFIPMNWVRQEIFKIDNIYVPCVRKEDSSRYS